MPVSTHFESNDQIFKQIQKKERFIKDFFRVLVLTCNVSGFNFDIEQANHVSETNQIVFPILFAGSRPELPGVLAAYPEIRMITVGADFTEPDGFGVTEAVRGVIVDIPRKLFTGADQFSVNTIY